MMDHEVMELTNSIGEVVDGSDFDTVMNALVYMLAYGGFNSGMKKEDFVQKVAVQLSELFDLIQMDNDSSTSITTN
jgi:hypothetical protein